MWFLFFYNGNYISIQEGGDKMEDRDKYMMENKSISEMWKEKMIETINRTYKGIPRDKLELFLDKLIRDNKKDVKIGMRNTYKGERFIHDLDTLPKFINESGVLIGANGTFMLPHKDGISEITRIIQRNISVRDKVKHEAIDLESQGRFKEAAEKDAISNKYKANTNSLYGIQVQKGSFLYNPDTASLITLQAREIITEMAWTLEGLFGNNYPLHDINELFLYIENCFEDVDKFEEYKQFVDNIPTVNDVLDRINFIWNNWFDDKPKDEIAKKALFRIAHNMTETERILFVYKNNLIKFLKNSSKISGLIKQITNDDSVRFLTVETKSEKGFPQKYLNDLEKMFDIVKYFCVHGGSVMARAEKYKVRMRTRIVISDTDSVMITFGKVLSILKKMYPALENRGNREKRYRLVNIFIWLAVKTSDVVANYITGRSNIAPEFRKPIYMKNEFYFDRVIIFTETKKNYVAHTLLREGEEVDKFSYTGALLGSSNVNELMKEELKDFFENYILKPDTEINPIAVIKRLDLIEERFKKMLYVDKNPKFGTKSNLGMGSYDNPLMTMTVRACIIWNLLYPEYRIYKGDQVYVFTTTLYTVDDLVKVKDDNIRYKIKQLFFDGVTDVEERNKYTQTIMELEPTFDGNVDNVLNYGLSYIAIPADDDIAHKIPDWIVGITNFNFMVDKHMSPLTNLLPSLNIYDNKINSSKVTRSSIISI